MHGLELIARINSESRREPHPLRLHPRIYALRRAIAGMAIASEYRARLYAALYRYADQVVARPVYKPDEGWDDLEALQQVTLGDWMEEALRDGFRHRMDGGVA